jgi:FtsP/CotA-like multicopper oxidase with cupredoxin domain
MKTLILLFISFASYTQIDYSKLIIGRNTGVHTFDDGIQSKIFGFAETLGESIQIPGPLLEIREGDSVKLDFWNVSQGAPHTIHLHGLDVNQQNDGVGMLSFEVHHMEHGFYYFKAPHAGTYLYHCHVGSTVHLQAGMYGLIIVRPPNGSKLKTWENGETYDREFSLLTSEIDTVWHNDTILNHEHDTTGSEPMYVPKSFHPQYYLMNGLNGTQLSDPENHFMSLKNEKVYMRLANIGYFGTRYIFPSMLNSRILSSDGRPLPQIEVNDTVVVLPGERYDAMIQLGTNQFYTVILEHFNLFTGLTASSQELTIQTSSLNVTEIAKAMKVYPNPSDGIFHVENPLNLVCTVINIQGAKILSTKEDKIDLTNYPNGIYYASLGEYFLKLVKY